MLNFWRFHNEFKDMENYHIYDAIGKGKHSTVYKARRKKSIEYFAIKSTSKCRMPKIINEVQFIHTLSHPGILHFYHWYESKNHIWLSMKARNSFLNCILIVMVNSL